MWRILKNLKMLGNREPVLPPFLKKRGRAAQNIIKMGLKASMGWMVFLNKKIEPAHLKNSLF